MPEWLLIWTEDEEDGNVPHLAEHGVTPEEFRQVMRNPVRGPEPSQSHPEHMILWGWTDAGRYLMAVYLVIDEATVMPVTAYDQTPKD